MCYQLKHHFLAELNSLLQLAARLHLAWRQNMAAWRCSRALTTVLVYALHIGIDCLGECRNLTCVIGEPTPLLV